MRKLAILLLAPALLSACAQNLKPAPSAREVAGMEDAARSTVKGVNLVAAAKGWPGPAEIKEEVTPVHVTLVNNSGHPLRVSYNLFALVGPRGDRYSALPPFKIEGTVEKPVFSGYGPMTAPGFGYDRFEVAPFYSPIYPDIPAYGGPYYYDPFYYDTYYPAWRDVELPTEEMVQRAIPEGILNTGGKVDGYIYFEKVSEEIPRVTFRADLVNPRTGRTFGEIRIPFVVD